MENLSIICHQVELEKYAKGVQWLQELLYAVRLTPDRLKVIATKMLKDVTRMKRKGSSAVGAVMRNMLFTRCMYRIQHIKRTCLN